MVGTQEEAVGRALADKQAIAEVMLRYCRGIDRLDMELVRSCYHPGAVDHHSGFEGERDAYVAWVEPVLRQLVGTQHMVGNHLIELDGDLARSETYVVASHLLAPGGEGPAGITTALRYVDRFERRDGEWRIAERFAMREWVRTEPDQRPGDPAEGPAGARDRSDPVFAPLRPADGPPTGARSGKMAAVADPDLQSLADKQAIYEVVLRYCRGVDRLDMDLLRSCYHPGAVDHHTGFEGEREAYVAWVEPLLRRLTSTQHMLGNHLVELDGDLARSETYGTAFHLADPSIPGSESFTTGFRYVDRFERRDGEWRIAERFAVREWTRPETDQRPRQPGEGTAGARDRTDPVYRPLR